MHNNILEGTFNFRDLGGYQTADGKTIKRGNVYRADALTKLTDNDLKTLKEIGLKTIVDFRGENEIASQPNKEVANTTTYVLSPHAPVAQLSTGNLTDDKVKIDKLLKLAEDEAAWSKLMSRGEDMALQMKEMAFSDYSLDKFRQVFELLLNPENTPLVFHCKGGKDRTGLMSVLFLMALGVPKETIIADYMQTKSCMAARNERRMAEYRVYTDNPQVLEYLASLMATKLSYVEIVFDNIEARYNAYEDYLIDKVKLTAENIKTLKTMYLE